MSLYARLAALLVIVLALAGAWWKFDRMLAAADRAGYERRTTEDAAAERAQADRNREQSRMAELHLSTIATRQDKFFTIATKEIHDASAPLAACLVPEPVRVRLNAAAACARQDRPASCGGPDDVPDAR